MKASGQTAMTEGGFSGKDCREERERRRRQNDNNMGRQKQGGIAL